MLVVVACLPVMVLHTLSVSMVSYQLIRKTAQQNELLDELRRMDSLTGLFRRDHWDEQAEAALRRHTEAGEPACMLMMDIDHFKGINDTHGHTVGDEALRALGHDGAHYGAPLAQAADQIEALIGGDAARNDQQDAPAVQHRVIRFCPAAIGRAHFKGRRRTGQTSLYQIRRAMTTRAAAMIQSGRPRISIAPRRAMVASVPG